MKWPADSYTGSSTQLITVQAADWHGPEARMQWFERESAEAAWRPVDEAFDVVVGKAGLAWGHSIMPLPAGAEAQKKEGDMKTPAGLFGFCFVFGYAPEPPGELSLPYLPLNEHFVGVDDPDSRYYNCIVNARILTARDWKSAETMWRNDNLYKWGIVVDYNFENAIKGAGSQIFIHIWRGKGQGTDGCIAMEEDKMTELLRWLQGAGRPLVWIY